MNEEDCCSCGGFFPKFETCPECDGQRYIMKPSDNDMAGTLEHCRYCYKGKIAIYYPERNWLSKVLCCYPKFNEPDGAKTRLLSKQLKEWMR
jgi:hypothetical protein